MNFDEFRRRADAVRDIPLEVVLASRGAVRDRHDRRQWHTERGPLSVTGAKFTNWHGGSGGGAGRTGGTFGNFGNCGGSGKPGSNGCTGGS